MKTLGILGGMGPGAGCFFYKTFVELTLGHRDQDHPPAILYSQTQIPDRGAYLRGEGEDPRPDLLKAVRCLQDWGADFIAIPCNTAHFFWSAIQSAVEIPVLNIIEITAGSAAETLAAFPEDERKAGILATEGTLQSGLFQNALKAVGVEALTPSEEACRTLQGCIAATKSGRGLLAATEDLALVGQDLKKNGARILILGCTELGLLKTPFDVPVVDSVTALAEVSVEIASGARAMPRSQPVA